MQSEDLAAKFVQPFREVNEISSQLLTGWPSPIILQLWMNLGQDTSTSICQLQARPYSGRRTGLIMQNEETTGSRFVMRFASSSCLQVRLMITPANYFSAPLMQHPAMDESGSRHKLLNMSVASTAMIQKENRINHTDWGVSCQIYQAF